MKGTARSPRLELVRQRMSEEGLRVDEAMRRVACQTVFTTHTPVPAGHDRFSAHLIDEHLGPLRDAMGMAHDHLMALGRVDPYNPGEDFCMTVLALEAFAPGQRRLVAARTGVAAACGPACGRIGPKKKCRSATSPTACTCRPGSRRKCGRCTTAIWVRTGRSGRANPGCWETIEAIDDGEIWETHQALKARLLDFVRRHAVRQAERRGEAGSSARRNSAVRSASTP